MFREFRGTLRRAIHQQIVALSALRGKDPLQEMMNESLDDQVIKSVFEETFIDRKKAANGALVPLPYELYVVDKAN